ncbi:MAG: protein translocase subunit SecDF, partial [Chlamydiia bacterium]|nr:protein translocase subunit SecDF [Chlamydiia bacterium]
MEKQKRWQLALIITVLLLTLYNILPTIFYYAQPLKAPVDEGRAMQVASEMVDRVNKLESEAQNWLAAYCKHLGLAPRSITIDAENPRQVLIRFAQPQEAETLKRLLPRAAALIPFQPARLNLATQQPIDTSVVAIDRSISMHMQPGGSLFRYTAKLDDKGQALPLYKALSNDRVSQVAEVLAGQSPQAIQIQALANAPADISGDQLELTLRLAREINAYSDAFGTQSPIAQRYFGTFSRGLQKDGSATVQRFTAKLDAAKAALTKQLTDLEAQQKTLKERGEFLDADKEQLLSLLRTQMTTLESASTVVKANSSAFSKGTQALDRTAILATLEQTDTIDLQDSHPFIRSLSIEWGADRVLLNLHDDVLAVRGQGGQTELAALQEEKLQQLLINEIARVSRATDEELSPINDRFSLSLAHLTSSQSVLALELGELAAQRTAQLEHELTALWQPLHADLERKAYPILDYKAFSGLSTAESKLGLVVYAPASEAKAPPRGFRTSSVYVIARGMKSILDKYQAYPDSDDAKQLTKDITLLQRLLADQGFFGYPAAAYGMAPEFADDFIFELNDYYSSLLAATREDLVVKGSHRYAVLEFTDVEQRILTTNHIEEAEQEELLKWREEYQSAQVDLRPAARLLVPPPTKNAYVENLKINLRKYFRGDDRKILRWGLDLSGGKSVRIGLRDQSNQP